MLVIPSTRRTTLGDRVFPLSAAPSPVRSAPSLLQFRLDLKTPLFQSQYSNGKKKNRNVLPPNAEGMRRGAEGARSFNAARGSGGVL